MLISCSNCEYSREIDDSKVPDWAEAVKCPQCGHRIPLGDPPLEFLPSYGANPHQSVGQAEPLVAATPAASQAIRPSLPQPPPLPGERSGLSGTPGETDIPWESRQGGFFRYFFSTISIVLFKPSLFFDRMRPIGGYWRPIAFMVILGYLVSLINVALNPVFQAWFMGIVKGAQGTMAERFWADLFQMKPYFILLVIGTFFSPLIAPLGLFVGSGIMYIFISPSNRQNLGFQPVYRIQAYTTAVAIFTVVPTIGGIVAFIWSIVITVAGLSQVYKLSKGEALGITIGVIALFFVLSIVLGMLVTPIIDAILTL